VDGIQILIPPSSEIVAGLPPSVRSAHLAASEIPDARIVFCGEDSAFTSRFRAQLAALPAARCVNGDASSAVLTPEEPLLIISGDGFPVPASLRAFVERSRAAGGPALWTSGGRPVAAYYPAASALAADSPAAAAARAALERPAGPAWEDGGWIAAADAPQAREAERVLFAALAKDTDGYIAALDRNLSIALSAAMLRYPITPNQITTASLLLGLLGAWWLASGSYGPTLAGAAVLWFCCLLDGCDGEVARLKLLCSPSGAAYDLWADHLAHLATFVALPIGVHRAFPGADFRIPGVLLVTGFLACVFSVWYLVLRKPESERGPLGLLVERVASRDYVYLILALAAVGRLDWFVYAAAVGSHAFWAALWLLV
jgi:phosphatidylglycerophosphate synthase